MKSIIITGATSGIGYQCALQLARIAPEEQIILACRNQQSGNETARNIMRETGHRHFITMPLDLDSLESVRAFRDLFSKMPEHKIVALINNAGLQIITDTQYTKDGFERTFGTNHLAPFYLTQLLLPFMEPDASITFTASGTHDPAQKTGVEPPVFADAEALAHPAESADDAKKTGMRRYSTSKLYNVLTTYALQKRLGATAIRVNAFDPGMVPGTGLARTYAPLQRWLWRNVFPVLRYFVRNINKAKDSGIRLANLAYLGGYKDARGKYFEGAKEIRSSADSYNEEYQQIQWTSSAALLGIKQKLEQRANIRNAGSLS